MMMSLTKNKKVVYLKVVGEVLKWEKKELVKNLKKHMAEKEVLQVK